MNYFIGYLFFYFLFLNNLFFSTSTSISDYEILPYFQIFNTSNLDLETKSISNKQKKKTSFTKK